jgi:hypothetical protein
MAYTPFADKLDAVAGAVATAAGHDAEVDGIQAEFEDRMEACLRNGVISGLVASISSTDIALSAGEAYCEGKRYSGAGTVAFNGAAANTYYVYVDPTNDAAPYQRGTTVPTSGQLTLASVVWSGSALSGLIDRREWGINPAYYGHYIAGSVTVGPLGFWIVPFDFWCDTIQIAVKSKPTGASLIVDLRYANSGATPTTCFTTTSYRPTITTGADAYVVHGNTGYIEANRKFTAGQIMAVYCDQTDSSSAAADITFCVRGRWC